MLANGTERPTGDMRFPSHGAERFREALTARELADFDGAADGVLGGRPGARIGDGHALGQLLGRDGTMSRIALATLGPGAKAVRAVLFDKTAATNWSVGWHQDRTIVVRERRDVPRYGPWTVKDGLVQVEPPFEVTAGMITLRAHLDDCGPKNAPLLVAPGSHVLGRIPAGEISAIVARLGQQACLAEGGDVWLYSTAILHASDAALKPRRRRVLQVDYACGELDGGLAWREVLAPEDRGTATA